MRLSLLLCTASPSLNAAHESLKDVSVFEPLAESIAAQRLPKHGVTIEVVIVDSLAGKRETQHLFPFEHKYLRAPAEFCFTNKLRHHNADRNAALAAATGELCYMLDDWCWFDHDPDHLARLIDYYRRGYFLGALVQWLHGPGIDEQTPYGGRDWRLDDWPRCENWTCVDRQPTWKARAGTPVCDECGDRGLLRAMLGDGEDLFRPRGYGVQAFSRKAAYDIGGYNELYDGGFAYSDLDFCFRLQASGHHRLALDLDHFVRHQRHGPPDADVLDPTRAIKCNRALYLTTQHMAAAGELEPRANWTAPTPYAVEVMRGVACPFYVGEGRCSANDLCNWPNLGHEHPLFQAWLESRKAVDLQSWHNGLKRTHRRAMRAAT